jgi:lysophospholipase L1-like esterase
MGLFHMNIRLIASCFLIFVASHFIAAAQEKLPKVVLIGDSIRLGYAPIVARQLDGKAVIAQSKANGGDSSNVVKNLKKWAIDEQPDVVHFNCGIHDIKKDKQTGKFQTPPEKYEANLRTIVETLRKETKAKVIFATTTPILDDRAARQREQATYELLDASTAEYNEIARRVMKELDVPIDDLRAALGTGDELGKVMTADGVHFTDEGRTKLGNAVAEFILQQLPVKK